MNATERLLYHHDNALCRGWQREVIRSMTECSAVDVKVSPLRKRRLRVHSLLIQLNFAFQKQFLFLNPFKTEFGPHNI